VRAGPARIEESQFLEYALGNDIKHRQLTSEYYQQRQVGGTYRTTQGRADVPL